MNFWQSLNKPIFVLAPMDEVTDTVFRDVVCKTAKPDVLVTEFTNVEGLNSAGRDKLLERLKYSKIQRPIVAQIWGINPENYYKAAILCRELKFDGIDINMGCPARTVTRNGACSALIDNPNLASEIIKATRKGAGDLPVSVKTRLGFKKIQTEEWISFLLSQNLEVLTVHGRVAKEMSKFPANWEEIGKVVNLRDKMGVKTLIIGNGDVQNRVDGLSYVEKYKVDGVMIGRGIFKDLWAFSDKFSQNQATEEQMLDLLLEHARNFVKTWGKNELYKNSSSVNHSYLHKTNRVFRFKNKNFLILRRFFKIYVQNFPNAASLREKLMQTKSLDEVENIISEYRLLKSTN